MSVLGQPCLSAQDAVVRFGSLHVLGPISLQVKAGECVVLLGPSGCGKSTLLAAFAGLQALESGVAQVLAENPLPGFVFQSPTLMSWTNAVNNIALPLELSRVERSAAQSRAQKQLEAVGLSAFASTKPRALSGGMAMRVALARALVTEPAALLLDEPFAAIDELGRRDLNDLVHTVKAQNNVAILFVTHSVEEAVYMGDRILVMSARPGTIVGEIHVPEATRDKAFLLSQLYSDTVSATRRALSGIEVTP